MTETQDAVMKLRRAYWRNGYRPVAIYTQQKRPIGNGWRADAMLDPPLWVRRPPVDNALSTGIATGTLIGIDVDVLIQEVVDRIVFDIEQAIGATPLLRIGRAPKTLLGFHCQDPFRKMATEVYIMPDGTEAKVEMLAEGQQFVADGIHPDTGQPYYWPNGCPETVPLGQVPEITAEQAQDIIAEARATLLAHGGKIKPKPQQQREHKPGNGAAGGDNFFAQVNTAALKSIAPWVKLLFPGAVYQPGTGAWRVASKDRGRPDLEEDISFHPDGVQDFGLEHGLSPIDAVLEAGHAGKAVEAAIWLCERIGIAPEQLGWHAPGKQHTNGHDHEAPSPGKKQADEEDDPYDAHQLPEVQWIDHRLSDWSEDELPERLWVVPDWIPREQVTGIYGPPGVNKTDFLIQLLMATSAGLPFIGYQLARIPVFGLFCEDTAIEIVRRATRIARHYGMHLSDFVDFHFSSLVGHNDLEFVTFEGNSMYESRALKRFDMKIEETGAAFACLDTAPHFFGGNEIDRRQVSRFLRKLDAISIVRGCGIAITAHPSARGRSSGRMDSGSTGWEGGVRARIALTRTDVAPDDGKPQPDGKDRLLTLWKSNYAPPGKMLDLICDHGVFTTSALDPEKAQARGPQAKEACQEKFLELLRATSAIGKHVNDSRNHKATYAPEVFAAHPDGKAYSVAQYVRALRELEGVGRIRYVEKSRRKWMEEVATQGNQNTT